MPRTVENLEQDNIGHYKRAEMVAQDVDLHQSEKEGMGWRDRGKGEGTETATSVGPTPTVPVRLIFGARRPVTR